jgi:hypothetical protein
LNILEKNGFELFVQAKLGPARNIKTGARIPGLGTNRKFDLVIALRKISTNDQLKDNKKRTEIDNLTRGELIEAVSKIDGIGNPAIKKNETLKEILTKFRDGNLNLSDY